MSPTLSVNITLFVILCEEIGHNRFTMLAELSLLSDFHMNFFFGT